MFLRDIAFGGTLRLGQVPRLCLRMGASLSSGLETGGCMGAGAEPCRGGWYEEGRPPPQARAGGGKPCGGKGVRLLLPTRGLRAGADLAKDRGVVRAKKYENKMKGPCSTQPLEAFS